MNKTVIYDGILEVLEFLEKNNILAVVITNKDESAAESIVKHYFSDKIKITIGANDERPLKPDPSGVLEVIGKFGLEKESCIFVGDSEVDIQTGKSAGVYTVAVSWGFRELETIKSFGPDVIVDKPLELLELIKGLM